MGDRTGIAWTDATWNPIRGCTRVSEGCRNCYAESVAARFSGAGLPYEGLTRDGKWTGEVRVVERHFLDPLRWEKPRRIFVNSMSDLFHPNVTDETIDRVFAVMALAPQHTFQVLTKRPERMQAYLSRTRGEGNVLYRIVKAAQATAKPERGLLRGEFAHDMGWPIRNVWLGVSVEDQATADARVPLLLQTPAAVRFISYEPALGPVDFTRINMDGRRLDALSAARFDGAGSLAAAHPIRGLDWIIVGGESGPRARPFDVAWARKTVADCKAAGVACFVKQLGATAVGLPVPNDGRAVWRDGRFDGRLRDRAGADPAEWPEDLRVREFPTSALRESRP